MAHAFAIVLPLSSFLSLTSNSEPFIDFSLADNSNSLDSFLLDTSSTNVGLANINFRLSILDNSFLKLSNPYIENIEAHI